MFAVIQLAVYGLMQIPVGLLLDRFGARPIITIGMVLMAVGQLVMAFAPNVGIAILARMLLGAGDAAVFPSVLRVIADVVPRAAGAGHGADDRHRRPGRSAARASCRSRRCCTPRAGPIAFGSLAGLGVLFTVLTFAVIRNRPPGRDADVSRRHRRPARSGS